MNSTTERAQQATKNNQADGKLQSSAKLPEFTLYQPKTHHPEWATLFKEAKELANKVRQVQKKSKKLKKARQKISAYTTSAKTYIENRKRDKQGREDLLPLYILWTALRPCNFSCTYCDDHRGNKYPDLDKTSQLTTEQANRMLDIMRSRTAAIYYAGGEPTMRKDLPQIMAHAAEKNYFPQSINTNGSLLHQRLLKPDWNNFLADIDVVIVSLDSLVIEDLKEMYVFNRVDHVLRNILMLRELKKEYGFKLMINCVVQENTLSEVVDVLNWANDLGITFTGPPVNYKAEVNHDLLSNNDYKEFTELLLKRHKQGHSFAGSYDLNEMLYKGKDFNCRNTIKPHIDHDGRIFWPCKAMVNHEPVMLNILDFDNVDDIWAEGVRRLNPDNFKGYNPEQCGGKCNWAQNYSTDCYLQGLRHPRLALRDMLDYARQS